MTRAVLKIVFFCASFSGMAFAAPFKLARSEAMTTLVACRALTAHDERLACYDREIARFDKAEQSQQVLVIDRVEADATRRGLFGLKLPQLRLLGTGKSELSKIDATIASVKRDRDNKISFTLEDGARWQQTDDRPTSLRMSQGTKVVIERASLGSFFATFEKFGSIRVKREN